MLLFLNHFDYSHGPRVFWKATLWNLPTEKPSFSVLLFGIFYSLGFFFGLITCFIFSCVFLCHSLLPAHLCSQCSWIPFCVSVFLASQISPPLHLSHISPVLTTLFPVCSCALMVFWFACDLISKNVFTLDFQLPASVLLGPCLLSWPVLSAFGSNFKLWHKPVTNSTDVAVTLRSQNDLHK